MLDSYSSCVALIPAYEPDEKLLFLLGELRQAGLRAVVVDDGSGAAWQPLFAQAAGLAEVLGYTENRGKGYALKYGLAHIRRAHPDAALVVTLDADGQHRVEDACRLCREAAAHPGALVLGSRTQGKGSPLRSRLGNFITRKVYALSTGRRVYDTQTGLRAFGRELLDFMLAVEGDRYEYEMNVLLTCSRADIPLREVAIATIYLDNNESSHFGAIRDSWRVYKEILKFSASSLASFAIDYLLYSLLLLAALTPAMANIGARLVSASCNYALNRRYVFAGRAPVSLRRSALQYFALAALILAGNTLLLDFLVGSLHFDKYAAKLLTEICFFLLSWLVQRRLIFRPACPQDMSVKAKQV